jgi:pimeloyl-ACP methyl ester carboxylesterase
MVSIGIFTILLNGCYVAPEVKKPDEALSKQSCLLMGKIIDHENASSPILIVAFSIQYSSDDQSQVIRIADSILLPESGQYALYVGEGSYYIAAYRDFNKDNVYTKDDFVGMYGHLETINISKQLIANLDITVSANSDNKFGFPISITPLNNKAKNHGLENGYTTTLDHEIFSDKYGKMGMWSPDVFMEKAGADIYSLTKYDKKKVPVLFVHGVGGSPRDFRSIAKSINKKKYQAWFFHYPSGMRLEQASDILYKKLTVLHSQHHFKKLHITAHSMGGLVTRSFIKKYIKENRFSYLKGYISMATPYGGNEASRIGAEYSPVKVPCWTDVATNSEFLKDLYSPAMLKKIKFYLFFGYAGNNRFFKDVNDGAISLKSQLDPRIKKEAIATIGVDADHTGILNSKEMLKKYLNILTVLNKTTGEESKTTGILAKKGRSPLLDAEIEPAVRITPVWSNSSKYNFHLNNSKEVNDSIQYHMDMLRSKDPLKTIRSAKAMSRTFPGDITLTETANRVLLDSFATDVDNKLHGEAMAWLCNILGLSRDIQYRLTLEKVYLETKDPKIKTYAKKNLTRLSKMYIPPAEKFKKCVDGDCINGQGTVVFPDGLKYSGGFSRGSFHGYGLFTSPNNLSYNGEWLNNKMHGQGRITYPDGTVYEGQVKNNMRYGNGTMFFPKGMKFTGQFAQDMRNGRGMNIFQDGTAYTGVWKNNKGIRKNKATAKTPAITKTIAQNNPFSILPEPSGTWGTKTLSDFPGDCISGDCINGQGIKQYNNGIKYTGSFKSRMRFGYGEASYQNGTKYTGYWVKNIRHGRGTTIYKNGTKYIGSYRANKRHGPGIVVFEDGKKFTGNFVNDIPSGTGVGVLADGTKYISVWKNGKNIKNEVETKTVQKKKPTEKVSADGQSYVNQFKDVLDGKKYYTDYLLYNGHRHSQLKDYTKAVACYQYVLDISPRHIKAIFSRGTILLHQGLFSEAISDFNKAISISPDQIELYNNRGIALHKKKQNKSALNDFTHALKLNPQNKDALNNRGCIFMAMGEFDKAIKDFNQMIKIDKNEDIGYYNRGIARLRTESSKKGLEDLRKAYTINPTRSRYKKIKEYLN